MKNYKSYSDASNIIMSKESVTVVTGSERMLSLGGGVRAKLGKTKEGKTVIGEFLFDKDRFSNDQAEKWLEENSEHINESLAAVQENAPKGSFSDITARVVSALVSSDVLPIDSDGVRPWYVEWVFTDSVIVNMDSKYFKVPYTESDRSSFTFGMPQEVDMEFVAKEGKSFLEKHERRISPQNCVIEEKPVFEFREAKDEKKQILAVLIEAGTNYSKRRYYPERTLREAAGLFSGLKMFIDHPTDKEDEEKPERSIREWVATIVESWFEDGKIMGRVQVHSDWLWESLANDEIFRQHIGISINAAGRRSTKTIDGQMMEVIEEIVAPRSVDWVTEPGARGRVLSLIESAKNKTEKDGDVTMLKTVTLKDLKEARPDLVDAVLNEGSGDSKLKESQAENTRLKEENERLKSESETRQKAEKVSGQTAKVKELIEASKLPDASKEALIERHKNPDFAKDEDLVSAVETSIKNEFAYLKKVGVTVKIGSEGGQLHENANPAAALEERLGLKESKKEDK